MKKLFLWYCITAIFFITPMEELAPATVTENQSDDQIISFQSNQFQALHTFLDYANNNNIVVPQELADINNALTNNEIVEMEHIRDAVKRAITILEPLQNDAQAHTLYQQLQHDHNMLLANQHKSAAFAGLQVFDKLKVYNELIAYGPVSINAESQSATQPALSVNGGAVIDDITANTTSSYNIILTSTTAADTGKVVTIGSHGQLSPASFAPGGVSSVNAGANISITGSSAAPIVNLVPNPNVTSLTATGAVNAATVTTSGAINAASLTTSGAVNANTVTAANSITLTSAASDVGKVFTVGTGGTLSPSTFAPGGLQTIVGDSSSATQSAGIMILHASPAGESMQFVGSGNTITLNSTDANNNTAIGLNAGLALTSGTNNTALGYNALTANTIVSNSTAIGANALAQNASSPNTAVGANALAANTTGYQNTALGYNALAANTTTYGNTAVGYNALAANTEINNTAVGTNALASNTTGFYNTALGFSALQYNTIGVSNVAVGLSALQYNTSGNSNVAVGIGALEGNTNGYGNIAVGFDALVDNDTGTANIAIGALALGANTTASNSTAIGYEALALNTAGPNTAVGAYALTANTTGYQNTAVGYNALAANTTGYANTAVGYGALATENSGSGFNFNNTAIGANTLHANGGPDNTAVGANALMVCTAGYNTALGALTLTANTSGTQNVALGTASLQFNTTGIDNVAVGYQALQSNTIGSNNTAIGYQALNANTTGAYNIAIGTQAFYRNTTGSSNIAIGETALWNLTTGSENVAIGQLAGANYTGGETNNLVLYNTGVLGDSNTTRIGQQDFQTTCYIAGINGVTITPTGGAVYINSNGQLGTTNSSQRYKDNIQPMKSMCDNLMAMKPVEFTYKSDENKQKQYGLVAEEVEHIDNSLIMYNANSSPETIYYQFLPPMLLKGWQEQQQRIIALEEQVHAMQQERDEAKVVAKKQQQKFDAFFTHYMKSHNNAEALS